LQQSRSSVGVVVTITWPVATPIVGISLIIIIVVVVVGDAIDMAVHVSSDQSASTYDTHHSIG
jgi:hypothetical protein